MIHVKVKWAAWITGLLFALILVGFAWMRSPPV